MRRVTSASLLLAGMLLSGGVAAAPSGASGPVPPIPGAGPVEVQTEPPPPVDATADQPPPSTYDRSLQKNGGEPALDEGTSLVSQLGRTIIALLVVVALIYAAGKVAMARLGRIGGGPGKILRVVERVALDNRHSLFLVEVEGGPTLVVGNGEKGVQLVASLDLPPIAKSEDTGRSFKDALLRLGGSPTPPPAEPEGPAGERPNKQDGTHD